MMNPILKQRGGDARYMSLKKVESLHQSVNDRKRAKSERLFSVIDLLAQGFTRPEIRLKLDLSPGSFELYERKIQRLVNQQQNRKVEELTFFAERRHNAVYRKALEAFERSCINSKGNPCAGNPLFLSIANESIRDIRKLLGLDRTVDLINNGNMALFQWDSLHKQLPNNDSLAKLDTNGSNVAQDSRSDNRVIEAHKTSPIDEKLRLLEEQAKTIKQIQEENGIDPVSVPCRESERSERTLYEPMRVVDTGSSSSQESVQPVRRKLILKRRLEDSSSKREIDEPTVKPIDVFSGCTED